jgi:hypothetical protein
MTAPGRSMKTLNVVGSASGATGKSSTPSGAASSRCATATGCTMATARVKPGTSGYRCSRRTAARPATSWDRRRHGRARRLDTRRGTDPAPSGRPRRGRTRPDGRMAASRAGRVAGGTPGRGPGEEIVGHGRSYVIGLLCFSFLGLRSGRVQRCSSRNTNHATNLASPRTLPQGTSVVLS